MVRLTKTLFGYAFQDFKVFPVYRYGRVDGWTLEYPDGYTTCSRHLADIRNIIAQEIS